jgi:hypothetical protein
MNGLPSASTVSLICNNLFSRLSVEQRNICRYRLRFLKYWDRLSTYEAILGGPAVAHDTFDSGFFSKFRDSNIVETAVEFARVKCFHHQETLDSHFSLSFLSFLPTYTDCMWKFLLPVSLSSFFHCFRTMTGMQLIIY